MARRFFWRRREKPNNRNETIDRHSFHALSSRDSRQSSGGIDDKSCFQMFLLAVRSDIKPPVAFAILKARYEFRTTVDVSSCLLGRHHNHSIKSRAINVPSITVLILHKVFVIYPHPPPPRTPT